MVDISQNGQKLLFKLTTVGVIKICALVFHELLSLAYKGCFNFETFCAHHQYEILRIPKQPPKVRKSYWLQLYYIIYLLIIRRGKI